MKHAADVRSLEAIRRFQVELKRYLESMRNVLESLHVQSNKAMDWIDHDRTRYWPRAAKQAEDRLVEARNQLLRCKMAAMEGQSKSCADEKKAVERAVARLRHCQSQVKVVRHWRQQIRHHTEEFSGKLARLAHYVEDDLPKAIAALERMIRALEKYAEVPPSAGPSGHSSSPSSPAVPDTPPRPAAGLGPQESKYNEDL